jgi:hypothetical protein
MEGGYKMSRREESENIFEEMFEKQVHEFVDAHIHLIKEGLNVFEMAKKFEDRYDYVIAKTEEQVQKKIDTIKGRNQKMYLKIISQRISQIETEMEKLAEDIEKSLEEHNSISNNQEIKIKQIYDQNKDKLLKRIINILDFNFV